MYLEGMMLATVVGISAQISKWVWPFLLLLWPIVLPIFAYKAYKKFGPIILELKTNPILGALLGINTGGFSQD